MSDKDKNKLHDHYAITDEELPWRTLSDTQTPEDASSAHSDDNHADINNNIATNNFVAPDDNQQVTNDEQQHSNQQPIAHNVAGIFANKNFSASMASHHATTEKKSYADIPPHHSVNAPPLPNNSDVAEQKQSQQRPTLDDIRRLVQERQEKFKDKLHHQQHNDKSNIMPFPKVANTPLTAPSLSLISKTPLLSPNTTNTENILNDNQPQEEKTTSTDSHQQTLDNIGEAITTSSLPNNSLSSDEQIDTMRDTLKRIQDKQSENINDDQETENQHEAILEPSLKSVDLEHLTPTTEETIKEPTEKQPILEDIPSFMRAPKINRAARTHDENEGLHIIGIEKSYKKRQVLNNISLHINRGEVVAILGPNGAGKTTCFYIVSGLIQPDVGHIMLDGKILTNDPMYRRARAGIGYLPQESSIFRGLTVEQNIMAILESQEKDRRKRRKICDSLMEDFTIAHLHKTMATALSGGERRRLEIARAIASNPEFILLDEPLAGIDPIAVQDIRDLVTSLKNRNIGVFITDHNVRETLEMVDRAYVLHDGKILCEGARDEIINNQDVRAVYLGQNFKI